MIANATYYLDKAGNLTTNADLGIVLVVRKGMEIPAELLRRYTFTESKPPAVEPKQNKRLMPAIQKKEIAKPARKRTGKKKVN
jgi:hypothetical protein